MRCVEWLPGQVPEVLAANVVPNQGELLPVPLLVL
jgi:hypothetical protein